MRKRGEAARTRLAASRARLAPRRPSARVPDRGPPRERGPTPTPVLGDNVPAARAAVASGWIRLCHRDQPHVRMLSQYRRDGGCVFDRVLVAKVLVPLRRGY